MKRIYYILFLAITLFSCEKPISEFQSENFIKFFGSGYESKGNDVIELLDGDYLITGYDKLNGTDQQVFVAKVDKNGNLIWSNTYGQAKNSEEGKVVKEVSDGYLIAGTSLNVGITHSFILKTDFEGNQTFYKEFGNPSYSITLTDIVVTDRNIYVAGYSDTSKVGSTDYYVANLNESAEVVWDKSFNIGDNSSFKRIFIKDGYLLLIGTDGIQNKIAVVPITQSHFGLIDPMTTGSTSEKIVDASLAGNQLFILSKGGASNTMLSKLGSSNSVEWSYAATGSIEAKSVALKEDGSLMIASESVVGGNSVINFIKINSDGTVFNGEQYFKTFTGNVGRIIETKDKGLIMVGSTNPTYGTNVQLIKTDKDYFMLKN